jgi:hypothetical protein
MLGLQRRKFLRQKYQKEEKLRPIGAQKPQTAKGRELLGQ